MCVSLEWKVDVFLSLLYTLCVCVCVCVFFFSKGILVCSQIGYHLYKEDVEKVTIIPWKI